MHIDVIFQRRLVMHASRQLDHQRGLARIATRLPMPSTSLGPHASS